MGLVSHIVCLWLFRPEWVSIWMPDFVGCELGVFEAFAFGFALGAFGMAVCVTNGRRQLENSGFHLSKDWWRVSNVVAYDLM